MNTPDHDCQTVETLAKALRAAMETANFRGCASSLQSFPAECCSHASSLMLILFYERGIEGFHSFTGRRPDGKYGGHEWVQRGDIVVDITADQFEELQLPAVIAGASPWHATLAGTPNRDALHDFDIPFYKQQTAIYSRIKETGHLNDEVIRSRLNAFPAARGADLE